MRWGTSTFASWALEILYTDKRRTTPRTRICCVTPQSSGEQDALMRATISRMPMLQNVPEIHREIMGFCVHFAVVVLTLLQRITFADVFIVGDVGSALEILGACFFGKHPYTEDRTYLGDIRHAILQMLLKITETWVWPAGAPK